MEKKFFTEIQKFSPSFTGFFLLPVWGVVNIIFGIGLYKQLGQGQPWGDEPMSDMGLIIVTIAVNIILIGTSLLMLKIKMIVEIRETGLFYRYPPFIIKEKKISNEEIERFEVRQYKPIQEYGGWGVRQRTHKLQEKGIAYNVRGNIGLQLFLKNGDKILFGTQRKEAITSAMSKMMGGRG